jgi:hypothetical protein
MELKTNRPIEGQVSPALGISGLVIPLGVARLLKYPEGSYPGRRRMKMWPDWRERQSVVLCALLKVSRALRSLTTLEGFPVSLPTLKVMRSWGVNPLGDHTARYGPLYVAELKDWKILSQQRLHHTQQNLTSYSTSDFKRWTLQHKQNTLYILQLAHRNYKQYLDSDQSKKLQKLITEYIPKA